MVHISRIVLVITHLFVLARSIVTELLSNLYGTLYQYSVVVVEHKDIQSPKSPYHIFMWLSTIEKDN